MRYICQQVNYSLVARDVEHEIVPLALDQGVGVMAWSPLHAGLLTGKFRRDARAGRQPPERARRARHDRLRARSTASSTCSSRLAAPAASRPAQVALNWVLNKPGVDTVIIGARDEEQLLDNLAAAAWRLSA